MDRVKAVSQRITLQRFGLLSFFVLLRSWASWTVAGGQKQPASRQQQDQSQQARSESKAVGQECPPYNKQPSHARSKNLPGEGRQRYEARSTERRRLESTAREAEDTVFTPSTRFWLSIVSIPGLPIKKEVKRKLTSRGRSGLLSHQNT